MTRNIEKSINNPYDAIVTATDALEEIPIENSGGKYLGDNVGSDGVVYGIIEYPDKSRKKIRL